MLDGEDDADYDDVRSGVELTEIRRQQDRQACGNTEDAEANGEDERDGVPLLEAEEAADERKRRARSLRVERARQLRRQLRLLWKLLVCLMALAVVLSSAIALLLGHTLLRETGLLYLSLPLTVHACLDVLALILLLHGRETQPAAKPRNQVEFQRLLRANRLDERRPWVPRAFAAAAAGIVYAVLDAIVSGFTAQGLLGARFLFTVESDGRIVPESRHLHLKLSAAAGLAAATAGLRVLTVAGAAAYLRARRQLQPLARRLKEAPGHRGMPAAMEATAAAWAAAALAAAAAALALTTKSASSHLGGGNFWEDDPARYEDCDPLDTTLCPLPFPSSFYLRADPETSTGFRVNFGERSLPYTRRRRHVAPRALNALDGFSTMAPLLFYLPGMSSVGLAGPNDIAASLFDNSSTVLLEAGTGRRVPHFCEVDALDPTQPLAILQPAEPLRHGQRYVVGVREVLGEWGELLPPTAGFTELTNAAAAPRELRMPPALRERAAHFKEAVFPLLDAIPAAPAAAGAKAPAKAAEAADEEGGVVYGAGWQLAWDFVTASTDSQLGLLVAMRDDASRRFGTALTQQQQRRRRQLAGSSGSGDGIRRRDHSTRRRRQRVLGSEGSPSSAWEDAESKEENSGPAGELFRIVKTEEASEGSIARTVFGVVSVPSYVGAGSRAAGIETLPAAFEIRGSGYDGNGGAIGAGADAGAPAWAEVGFTLRVPRSVAKGAPPAAVVQYGHGLFGDRAEVDDGYLGEMAEKGRWLLVSTDWRGMSRFDLPTVARILVSEPELFEATVANIMQSFVNLDAVLQLVAAEHLALAAGSDAASSGAAAAAAAAPSGLPPKLTFYGISEGGILGAGYSAFSERLERAALGSAGTPFALLLSRSVDFATYDALLRLNMRGGRDARILLSLMQMLWDRVEAAGWLAAPPAPIGGGEGSPGSGSGGAGGGAGQESQSKLPILLQAGSGDSEVPTIGTEILARALGAIAVAPSPLNAFGVPEGPAPLGKGPDGQCSSEGASVAWYEYVAEEESVPASNLPPPFNWVHVCVRHDPDAQRQVLEFVATGCVENYCAGACRRPRC